MKHWRLSNADVLARVKQILAAHWQCDEAEAYSRLQRIAALKKRKLRAMARDVFVAGHGLEALVAVDIPTEPAKRNPCVSQETLHQDPRRKEAP